jgi:hypothetical protein
VTNGGQVRIDAAALHIDAVNAAMLMVLEAECRHLTDFLALRRPPSFCYVRLPY